MINKTLTLGEHLTLPVEERVMRLVAAMTGFERAQLVPTARLFHDLRIAGDDVEELLVAFADQFQVDITGFDFYKYFPDEGQSDVFHQALLWESARRALLPLTVGDLIAAATEGAMPTAWRKAV